MIKSIEILKLIFYFLLIIKAMRHSAKS